MEEDINADKVEMRHFDVSLQSLSPQTPLWLLKIYEKFSGIKKVTQIHFYYLLKIDVYRINLKTLNILLTQQFMKH